MWVGVELHLSCRLPYISPKVFGLNPKLVSTYFLFVEGQDKRRVRGVVLLDFFCGVLEDGMTFMSQFYGGI